MCAAAALTQAAYNDIRLCYLCFPDNCVIAQAKIGTICTISTTYISFSNIKLITLISEMFCGHVVFHLLA